MSESLKNGNLQFIFLLFLCRHFFKFSFLYVLSKISPSLCRDEVNRLMEVINSRAVELPNVEKENKYQSRTPGGETKAPVETKGPAASQEIVEMTSERSQRDLHGSLWKTSTPLPQSIVRVAINLLLIFDLCSEIFFQ